MAAITLHALDDQLAAALRRRAQEQSVSMNELAKRLLAEALGLKAPASAAPHREEFARFSGVWTAEEALAFEERTAGCSRVDPADWR